MRFRNVLLEYIKDYYYENLNKRLNFCIYVNFMCPLLLYDKNAGKAMDRDFSIRSVMFELS